MSRVRAVSIIIAIVFLGAAPEGEFDPDKAFRMIMTWKKPDPYPPPMLQGMDIPTLSTLLDAGNLQWYESRPEKDIWDGVVGMKVHAPPEVVWDIMIDYELQCEIMPDTFDHCETEYRKEGEAKNNYKIHTSVIMYSYKMDMVDMVKEDPPYHMHIKTVEGGLIGRELNILLVPVNNNEHTLLFIRYYATLKTVGTAIRLAVSIIPQVEPPTIVSAANYHARAYRNEAEKRVGYEASRKPPQLKIENLDIETLLLIDSMNGGLIRETPEGKVIDALTYTFINAPHGRVWEVATDFERYEETFPGSECEVELIDGNTVVLLQETHAFSLLIFEFGYELHSQYILEPPYHLTYTTIDGTYEGSHGDLRLMPIENGTKTLAFAIGGVNTEKDAGLVSRIARSGAFPIQNMINMLGAQSTLAHIKLEAERREGR